MFENSQNDISMAPNSNFIYSTFLGDHINPGNYILKLQSKANDRTWNWVRNFTIINDEANKLNKEAKNDPEPKISIWWYVIIAILVLSLLIIIALIVLMLLMKRRKKQ